MKKILSTIVIINILLGFLLSEVNATDNNGYFVVTAYYSPLPDQEYYLTGNYESEKRLNGQGIRGASGKEVFSGMLAAPKNYTFGTKIYLEGLGVGAVEDRGGAIVNAGNRGYSYDRIDVWMGYGDEGLRRALYWGKRTVKGNFVSNNSNVTLNYYTIASPEWATKGLNKVSNIFSTGLGKGSDLNLVKELQELLKDAELYMGDINGIYNNEVIDIIYDFQIENDIIKLGEYYGAGYWGKSTRALFLKKYLNGEFDKEIIKIEEKKEIVENEIFIEIEKKDLSIFDSAANNQEKIKKLQTILKELSLYDGKLTGIYKDVIDPIYYYQLSKGIVIGVYSPGAGNFGPKTRASLKETYNNYLDTKELNKIEQARIDEENRLEQIRIEEEKIKAEARKKELEEKYKHLEKLSLEKAEEKLKFIGTPKFGEVSHSVRELQLTLKDLGFFEQKDTAIYGPITKESIIAYQIDRKLISLNTDPGAGSIGPKTRDSLKEDLKERFLKEIVITEKFNEKELAGLVGNKA
ncbi:MAG: hypothetical protein QM490_05230 [Candidatus Gracilibacteria bacterium]